MIGWDLLRLEGYYSTATEEIDGVLYVGAELVDPAVPACACEAPDVVKHGKRVVNFRDHPIQRQETYLRVTRQRYRCRNCKTVLLEDLPGIDPARHMTERFRDQLANDAVRMKFTASGEINGVKESLVRSVFKAHAAEMLKNYTFDLPRVMGMDEKVLGGTPRFVIGDVENRVLLDILLSRKQTNLEDYFSKFDFMARAKVEVITQDMYWAYKTLNERLFRKAVIVVDRFHVTRYADYAVSAVRKSVQNSLDNEGRIELKSKIGLLQARPGKLNHQGKWELNRLFRQHPAIETAVTVKEWFYDIYHCETRAEAEKAYEAWRELLPPEMEKPFKPILSFMREKRWRKFIFNYFDHRYTNGYVEAVNGLLDEISRAGRGYDLQTLRAKALLKYGNVKPLIDIVAFDLMGVDPEDREEILTTTIGHGFDPSTFAHDLRAGTFW